MKTAMIIYEGMADRPIPALEDRTPMAVARCSFATGMAVTGCGGLIVPARAEDDNRPEVRLGRLLGMSTDEARALRRGPLEALGLGVHAESGRWVYRADYVTVDETVLVDGAVKGLSMQETEALTAAVQAQWEPETVALKAVKPGCVVAHCRIDDGDESASMPPARAAGSDYRKVLPKNKGHAFVHDFLSRSHEALKGHPVNEVRVDLGENPANALWPWGGGAALQKAERPTQGVMATQSVMARGLAESLGMHVVELANPWVEVKGKRAPFKIAGLVEALREHDRIVVYVEAPNNGGRYGTASAKVWALETLDHCVLGPVLSLLEAHRPFRLLLTTDGAVSTKTGTAVPDPVPFILSGEGIEPDGVGHWDEAACAQGALGKIGIDELLNLWRKE